MRERVLVLCFFAVRGGNREEIHWCVYLRLEDLSFAKAVIFFFGWRVYGIRNTEYGWQWGMKSGGGQ